MTQRNNTRDKVVSLATMVSSLIVAVAPPSAIDPTNRPSLLNEDHEDRQPQPITTSLPTPTPHNTYSTTQPLLTILTKTKIRFFFNLPIFILPVERINFELYGSRVVFSSTVSALPRLVSYFFKSTMEMAKIFIDDNRTNTIGTFVPSDSVAI